MWLRRTVWYSKTVPWACRPPKRRGCSAYSCRVAGAKLAATSAALVFRLARLVREFLAGDGDGIHQSALRNGKHCHTFFVDALGGRILLLGAGSGACPIGRGARVGARGDGYHTRVGAELKAAGLEFVQSAFILEENDLAVRLATGLKADTQLAHFRITDIVAVQIHASLAERAANAQRP